MVNNDGLKDSIRRILRQDPDCPTEQIYGKVGPGHSRETIKKTISNVRKELGISPQRAGSGPKTKSVLRIPAKSVSHVQTNPDLEKLSSPVRLLAGRSTSLQLLNNTIDSCFANIDMNAQYAKTTLEAIRLRREWEIETAVVENDNEYHRAACFSRSPPSTSPIAIETLGAEMPWQDAAIDFMLEHDVLMKGSRRCSKSLLAAVSSFETLYNHRNTLPNAQVIIIAGKQEQGARPLNTLYENAEVYESISQFIDRRNKWEIRFKWGGTLKCIPPTATSTRGVELLALVTDEAAITKPEAIAQILPGGDTVKDFHWWMVGTPETGTAFHKNWNKPAEVEMSRIDVEDAMCNWIIQDNRRRTELRLKALCGEAFAVQELKGQFTATGGVIFAPSDVEEMFEEPREQFPKPEQCDMFVGGLDVHFGHPTCGELFGRCKGHWWELDFFAFQGDDDWPLTTAKVLEWNKRFPQVRMYCPTDNGGKGLIKRCKLAGVNIIESNWGTLQQKDASGRDYALTSKSVPITLMMERLITKTVHASNGTLESQMYGYKADKKNDDQVDACLQAVWHMKESTGGGWAHG